MFSAVSPCPMFTGLLRNPPAVPAAGERSAVNLHPAQQGTGAGKNERYFLLLGQGYRIATN